MNDLAIMGISWPGAGQGWLWPRQWCVQFVGKRVAGIWSEVFMNNSWKEYLLKNKLHTYVSIPATAIDLLLNGNE